MGINKRIDELEKHITETKEQPRFIGVPLDDIPTPVLEALRELCVLRMEGRQDDDLSDKSAEILDTFIDLVHLMKLRSRRTVNRNRKIIQQFTACVIFLVPIFAMLYH